MELRGATFALLPLVAGITLVIGSLSLAQKPQPVAAAEDAEALRYDGSGNLLAPANYREWVWLSSGLGMDYNEAAAADATTSRRQNFTNVFVNPSAYRAFLQTGAWPDKTIMVMEIRGSESNGSINKGGQYQGDLLALEIEVKDEKKFTGNWAFFDIDLSTSRGAQLPTSQQCYSCHAQHGAVDNTFVQFYPTLAATAKQRGTFKESVASKK